MKDWPTSSEWPEGASHGLGGAGKKRGGAVSRLIVTHRDELAVVIMRGTSLVTIALGAILAARLLGAEEYGRYTTASAFIIIALAAISAGHVERALRAGASGEGATGEQAALLVRDLLKYAPAWIVILLPFGLTSQVSFAIIAVIGIPMAVLLALAHVLQAFSRGRFRQLRDLVPVLLFAPAVLAIGCAIALAFDAHFGTTWLLTYRLSILVVVLSYFVKRLGLYRPAVWRKKRSHEVERLRGFAVAKILFAVQQQSSILIAGLISAQAAGQYTAAFRSVEPIIAGLTAVMLLVGPSTAVAAQRGELSSIRGEIKLQSRIGFALAIVPAAIVLIWPSFVLGLFGPGFTGATEALRILAVGALIMTFFGPSVLFSNMANLKRYVAFWMGCAVVFQLGAGLTLLAMDELTVTRVAVIDVIGTTMWNLGLWFTCRRKLHMTTAVI